MQVRNWDYQGWSDTKFVKPEDFGTMIDLPRFYETIPWAHNVDKREDNPEEATKQKTKINSDSVTAGELLVDFFEFFAFTFDNDKQAIDIRNHSTETDKSSFRPREEFVAEAKAEF